MQNILKFRDHAEVQTKPKRAIGNIRNLLKKKTTSFNLYYSTSKLSVIFINF